MWSSRKKSAVAALVAAAVLSLGLAGCSTGGDGGDEGGTINFVTFVQGDGLKKYTDVIDAFEAANPGVTVNLESVPGDDTYDNLIKTRIQGGTAPDIFEVKNGIPGEIPYTDANLLLDLSDEPWVDTLLPAIADQSAATGGKTYSFTTQVSSEGVFYNKDIFEQYGVEIPTTWDEFLDVIQTFKDAGVTPMGVGAKDSWTLSLQGVIQAVNEPELQETGNSTSASLIDGSAKYADSDVWRKIMDDFTTLVEAGAYSPDALGVDFPTSASDFALGKSAMFAQGDFAISAIRGANPDLNMGYFVYPGVDEGDTAAVALNSGGVLAIPVASANQELAKKFLDFLAQPDVMTQYLTTAVALPSVQDVSPTLDPALSEILPAVEAKGVDAAFIGIGPDVSAAWLAGLQGIVAGTETTETVLAAMDAANGN